MGHQRTFDTPDSVSVSRPFRKMYEKNVTCKWIRGNWGVRETDTPDFCAGFPAVQKDV